MWQAVKDIVLSIARFIAFRPLWADRLGAARRWAWLVLTAYVLSVGCFLQTTATQDPTGVISTPLVWTVAIVFGLIMAFFAWLPAWVLKQPQARPLLCVGLGYTSLAGLLWFIALLFAGAFVFEGLVRLTWLPPIAHPGQIVSFFLGILLLTAVVMTFYYSFLARTALRLVSRWQSYALGILLMTGLVLFQLIATGLIGQVFMKTSAGSPAPLGAPAIPGGAGVP